MNCDIRVPEDVSTIQEAVDTAGNGDTVCVGPGMFYENIAVRDGLIVRLVGSGQGRTVIDGGGLGSVIDVGFGADATFRGFTLRNGSSTSSGGGVTVSMASVVLEHVTLSDNEAALSGGALMVSKGYAGLDNVRILRNQSAKGGGIALWTATLEGTDVDIIGNHAEIGGGGIYANEAALVLDATRIIDNTVPMTNDGGGGVWGWTANTTLTNSIIAGNTALGTGGGLLLTGYDGAVLTNVVVAGNHAMDGGAAFVDTPQSGIAFSNAIVVRNTATDGVGSVRAGEESYATWAYSDVWHNAGPMAAPRPRARRGNVALDPQFVAYDSTEPHRRWDFRLAPMSPLIDAGDPDDRDPDGTRSDMGAYGGPGGDWR